MVVNYATSKAGADRVVSEIAQNGGKAVAMQANVAKKAEIERLFSETDKVFGKLDILVNNAGIYEFSPLEGVTEEPEAPGAAQHGRARLRIARPRAEPTSQPGMLRGQRRRRRRGGPGGSHRPRNAPVAPAGRRPRRRAAESRSHPPGRAAVTNGCR